MDGAKSLKNLHTVYIHPYLASLSDCHSSWNWTSVAESLPLPIQLELPGLILTSSYFFMLHDVQNVTGSFFFLSLSTFLLFLAEPKSRGKQQNLNRLIFHPFFLISGEEQNSFKQEKDKVFFCENEKVSLSVEYFEPESKNNTTKK